MAGTASVPNTFVAATDAVAAEVNANFESLVDFINDNMVHKDGTTTITPASTQTIDGGLTVTGTLTLSGNLNAAASITGDIVASNGTSIVLDNGTNGSDATFKGDIQNASGTTIVDVSAATFNGNATTSSSTTGNAATASEWLTARTLTLSGDVTGNVSIDGSQDVTLTTTVGNDSHTHDTRYYTETESDARFLRSNADDTTTGRLTINTTNTSTAGSQSINVVCATNTSPDGGISFQYGTGGTVVNHGVFRMSNNNIHRFVFLQEDNSSLADAQLQSLYYSGSLTSTSDETLKNNEGPALGLSFVNRLAPFTGTWIDGDGDKHQFLGAQSVEAALTAEGVNAADYGMIGNDSEIGPRTMSYMELVPVLVQAVNDLTARLEAVEAA